jgi:hypothetical protein
VGEAPVRAVYLAAALYLAAVLECLSAMGDSVTAETTGRVVQKHAWPTLLTLS